MTEILKGKVASVTGSTSGIGEAIAKGLAAEGASVIVSGRRKERGEKIAEEIIDSGGSACFVESDVTSPEDCRRICRAAQEEFGGLDTLVNNAGIFTRRVFEEISPEFWDKMFAVNIRGAFLCSQAAVPLMKKRGGGSIINIGSAVPFGGSRKLFAYACSKRSLHGMTELMARMLAGDQIRVNWITVGWVLTEKELEIQALEGRSEKDMRKYAQRLPTGRFNTAEEYADLCVFLASEKARSITGTSLNAAAGMGIRM